MRVLIADDQPLVRLDLRDQLERRGYDVCAEARDGAEAVALARASRPDVAVLDVRMPRLDGIAAGRRLRDEAIPVVLLTGYGRDAAAARAAEAGAAEILAKPFTDGALLAALRWAVGARPAPRRGEILAAAARLFHERGVAGTSVRDIADAVGLLKGSLYHHVRSKQAIVDELVAQAHERASHNLALAREQGCDPLDTLSAFALLQLELAATRPHDARLLFTDPHVSPRAAAARATYEAFVREQLERGREEGLVRPDADPGAFWAALRGLTEWTAGAGRAANLRAAVDHLVSGITTRERG
jgi:response regulator NasT